MATIESLLPLCRRHAAGCPDFVLIEAVRYAAREFCRDSWFLRRTLSVSLNPGQGYYDLVIEGGAEEVIGVDAVTLQGAPLQPLDPKEVPQKPGKPRGWMYLPPATLELAPYPAPDATGLEPVLVSVIVQPIADADSLGDDLVRQFDHALADGAVARVCALDGAAWSSPDLSARHGLLFHTAKMNAKGKALRAHQPRGLAVRPVRFC